MEKRHSFGSAGCPTRWWRRSSRSPSCFSSGPRPRRCGSRCWCRTPSAATREFVWFENFRVLFADEDLRRVVRSPRCSRCWSRAGAFDLAGARRLLPITSFAVRTDYQTLIIWPYAVAPAIAAVLWPFMFNPTLGIIAHWLTPSATTGIHLLNGSQAMTLVVISAVWKQIRYNFLFFLAGLQSIPKSLIEAAAIDGAGPGAALLHHRLPAAVADLVLPAGGQPGLRLFRHLRHHRRGDARRARPGDRRSWSTRCTTTASRAWTSAARRRSR